MADKEYIREYNKDTYKTVKIYIRKEEYKTVETRANTLGFKQTGSYIKSLIDKDIKSSESVGGGQ